MQLSTTFNLAHQANACESSYKKMGKALGGFTQYGKDIPFPLAKVLEVCGLNDALWCLRCTLPEQAYLNRKVMCLFLADCLEHIEPLLTDARSKAVIPLLRRRAIGQATDDEITAAWAVAWAAAGYAAGYDAGYAARAAARAAARDAAWDAAEDAAWAAARIAAEDAAGAAAARGWQSERLRHHLTTEEV